MREVAHALREEGISLSQAFEKMGGGTRTDDQISREGAAVSLRQIAALRHQLDRLEQCCRHVAKTGKTRPDDGSVWRQATDAADALLDGMA